MNDKKIDKSYNRLIMSKLNQTIVAIKDTFWVSSSSGHPISTNQTLMIILSPRMAAITSNDAQCFYFSK